MHRSPSLIKKIPGALYLLTIALPRLLFLTLLILSFILRWGYNLSGLRHIWEMLWIRRPNAPDYEKPPTFFLWVIGIYVALYGIASTNYEAALDRAENRMGALASQLATTHDAAFKQLIGRIPKIQAMQTPLKPDLLYPFRGHPLADYVDCLKEDWKPRETRRYRWVLEPAPEPPRYFVLCSLLRQVPNPEIVQWSKETIEDWQDKLAGVNLLRMNLSGARLWEANLSGARLWEANLSRAGLWEANLSGAWFRRANLSGAELSGANLSGAWLRRANLSGARLGGEPFGEIENWQAIASIQGANIRGVMYAPEGFRAWALENGAVEMEAAAWQAFLKEK